MLVLERKAGESIMIGDDIEVFFVRTNKRNGRGVLAISAPKNIPVHRKEVYDAIQREKQAIAEVE